MDKKATKPIMWYFASFLLPFMLIVVALIGLHVTPFGDNTLVIADANGLYINYLGYVGRLVKGLEGMTYSFEKGLGGNMMPHMGGTMSNPVFALVALFNIADYPLALGLISMLNFSLCGLTMYLLLADVYGHKRSNLIFSTSYALSGFLVANVFQIIFFTGPQALPLMVLGLRKLFQGKNPLLYILSLAYSLLTSAYFGFTLCVASVLLFFTKLWLDREALSGKKLCLFIHYAIASLCGGLLAIIIWLPAFMGIMGGRLDQTGIRDFSFWERMPFLEIFSKLFTGANNTAQLVNGLPNIFVGLLPVALVVLFFLNTKIDRRAKCAAGALLAVYLLSFYIIAFDMVMHAGTTTNWFNHRYSYIFSFLLLMIAAHEWQYIEDISFTDLKRCFLGMLIAAILVFSKRYEYVMGSEVLLDFALLALIFLAYRLHRLKPQFNPMKTFETVAILVVSISLFLNYTICTYNLRDWGIKESDYKKTVTAVSPLVEGVKQADKSFYRMEVSPQRVGNVGNDPMLYGYYGVSHGGSNERNFVREELNKLGVQWFDMRNYYAPGIPAATDTLLGLKYMISKTDLTEEKQYIRLTDMEAVGIGDGDETFDLYRNPDCLPIAMLSGDTIDGLSLNYDDVFDNLNRVWRGISGSDRLAFEEEDDIQFRTINFAGEREMGAGEARDIVASFAKQSADESASTSDSEREGDSSASSGDELSTSLIMDEPPMFTSSIEFSWVARQDGPVYVYHRAALSDTSGSADTVIKYMGNYHKGDVVTGYLLAQGDYVNRVKLEEFAGRFRAAYADLDALREMSEVVRQRPTEINRVTDSHLTGSFTAGENQKLLFTIPWDAGWTCRIDGQEAEIEKVLGVFMAVNAAPGAHTFEMKYVPGGLTVGAYISGGTLAFLILYLLFIRKRIDRVFSRRIKEAPEQPESCEAISNGLV